MFDDYGNDYFYEIYVTKNPAKAILDKIKLFPEYEISKAEKSSRFIQYFDTQNNYLEIVKCLLSIDLIDGVGELTLEKNLDNEKNAKYIRLLQTYRHSTPFTSKDKLMNFLPFLRDSLRSFFSKPLDVDTDNVFKRVIPKYTIDIKNESYKIVDFSGFKCWLTIEYTTYQNVANKRKNYVTYVKVHKAEDSNDKDMSDFIFKLEKYCKRITKLTKSKYSECVRLTRDIDVIIDKKKALNKSRKVLNNTDEEFMEQKILNDVKR